MIGKSLGHYQILEHIGSGGMGEVYRALDTQLKREVALKLLPTEFSEDPERSARFEREATTLASLQHPNIAAIHGFEKDQNRRFLVMELVPGEELATLLRPGPMPLADVLETAVQLCDGLEAAHAQGVVHRDLKPANIKITPARDVKILDFGLARAYTGDVGSESDLANSPTITAAMTQAGMILGTAAYMSPEQARGRALTQQTDIWSFGVVLFEMLSGRRLFDGETVSDSIGAILHRDPDLGLLPAGTPASVRRLLSRCLQRDPRQRLRHIGDARLELEDARNGDGDAGTPAKAATTWAPWIAAAVLILVAGALGWLALRPAPLRSPYATLAFPSELAIDYSYTSAWPGFDLSPDGRLLVRFGGSPSALFLRETGTFEERVIAGTEGAHLPVFSQDGRWIAYYGEGRLWKVATSGGAPIPLCETNSGPGLCWGQGEIFFKRSDGGGIWKVSEDGGQPVQVSSLDDSRDETSHRWPQLLPDGRHLLITIKSARIKSFDDAEIGIVSLETGESRSIFKGGSYARYLSTGHLIYGRNDELYALPFDLENLRVEGTPVPVQEEVSTIDVNGAALMALGDDGTLAYALPKSTERDIELFWRDRNGKSEPLDAGKAEGFSFYDPDLSPDGKMLAGTVAAANDKVWTYDLRRGGAAILSRTPGNDTEPLWSPDGRSVVYMNDRAGQHDVYIMPVDGSAAAKVLLDSERPEFAHSFSPDGRNLLYSLNKENGDWDLWVLPMDAGAEPFEFVSTPDLDVDGVFSPNGRWVAYATLTPDSREVYVRPFPGPGPAIRVSTAGGMQPKWSADGSELYYRSEEAIMVVPLRWEPELQLGDPVELIPVEDDMIPDYVTTPDPNRFLLARGNFESGKIHSLRLIYGWTERLKQIR